MLTIQRHERGIAIVQARGGGRETAPVAKLLELSRVYAKADWRTLCFPEKQRLVEGWVTLWRGGHVPDFAHIAPERKVPAVPQMSLGTAGIRINTEAVHSAAPGYAEPFRPCAYLSCTNMTGLSERGVKTFVCGGCMTARFCSKACARKAHALHKEHCAKLRLLLGLDDA